MNERQPEESKTHFQVQAFMDPIRRRADRWLQLNVYPSQEYKALPSELKQEELAFAHLILGYRTEDLAIMETIKYNPKAKGSLGIIMEPLTRFRFPLYVRIGEILRWDMKTKATDFLKMMADNEKSPLEDLGDAETKRLMAINSLATKLIANIYGKHEGIAKQILTDEN